MKLKQEQIEIIHEYYPVLTPQEVAEMVGMKKVNVIAYASRHGISNNRYWSKEEEQYLKDKYGTMTVEAISKKLGRTYRAVLDKLKQMDIGNFLENADGLHLAEVCRLVNRDKETIKETWVKYGLKIRKKGKYSIIHEDDLAKFMKENPDRWDATECEYWYFDKYDWFKEKRLLDREKMCRERWKVAN